MTARTSVLPRIAAVPAWRWFAIASLILLLAFAAILASGGRPSFGPPTNGRIVFGRFDAVQGDTVIYTVNPDGSHLRQLRPETHECPYWSPDGKRITVTSDIMNGDGSGFHPLTQVPNGPLFVGCGVWSTDGKTIVAEGWNDDDPSAVGLYAMRSADGGGLTRLTTAPSGHDVPIGFSPDGGTIAMMRATSVDGPASLFLVDADGANPRQLGNLVIGGGDWAPDGRSILVNSDGKLYGVDISSGNSTQYIDVANPTARLSNPQWSPDGTRILFRLTGDFYTMRSDGTDEVRITSDPADEYFADWGTYPVEP